MNVQTRQSQFELQAKYLGQTAVAEAGRSTGTPVSKEVSAEPTIPLSQHKCQFCARQFAYKSLLDRHSLTHTGRRPFPCNMCSKRFCKKQDLQSHMKTHVDEFPFVCSNCFQGFHEKIEKMEHENQCKVRRYECYLCKKYSTPFKTDLQQHIRIHSGQKSFECDNCDKKFASVSNLKRHILTHEPKKPSVAVFKCEFCPKKYTRKGSVLRHVKSSH